MEKLKEAFEAEIETLRAEGEELENNMSNLKEKSRKLEAALRAENQKFQKLTFNMAELEDTSEKITKELTETKRKLGESREEYDEITVKLRERQKRLREMENFNEDVKDERDKYYNRMNHYESETKGLRRKVNEQIEEIGTLNIESQRLARERDNHKRNCDMSVHDFEVHKRKCTENLKKLKEEILLLSSKIVEKDRLTMKQKEHFQDQIDNTQSDLLFLRKMLDGDIKKRGSKRDDDNTDDSSDSPNESLSNLRNTHDKYRDEFQSHVSRLEDMLKDTNDSSDLITVVQSPMSKIKLEELKEIRNEVFELNSELQAGESKSC